MYLNHLISTNSKYVEIAFIRFYRKVQYFIEVDFTLEGPSPVAGIKRVIND